jgi:5-methylthioadenosine/S-adenosylhomocysteine deaminase
VVFLLYGIRGNILTLDERDRFLKDHVVLVDSERGVVHGVLPYEKALEHRPEFIVGGRRYLVTPGLVNTHTHIPMYVFKGTPIRKTGFEWLRQVWAMESCLKPRHVYYGALAALVELVENGVVLYGDMYFYEDEVAKATKEVGLRASLSLGVIELFEGPPKHSIEDSIRFAARYKSDELVRGMIGVHALYSVSLDSVKRAVEASRDQGVKIHIHFAESLDEVRFTKERYGKTPAQLADELGLLSVRPLLAHAVYVDDRDLELLARSRPYVSYCPFTIMSWGSGVARVLEYIERGVPVTVGTDGPLTAGVMSPLFEMKVALAAQGSRYARPVPLDVYALLKSSVWEGSRALGWEYSGIAPGAPADVVLWEPPPWADPSEMSPTDAAFSLVYDHQYYRPVLVVVSGRAVNKSAEFNRLKHIVFEKIREVRQDLLECGGVER